MPRKMLLVAGTLLVLALAACGGNGEALAKAAKPTTTTEAKPAEGLRCSEDFDKVTNVETGKRLECRDGRWVSDGTTPTTEPEPESYADMMRQNFDLSFLGPNEDYYIDDAGDAVCHDKRNGSTRLELIDTTEATLPNVLSSRQEAEKWVTLTLEYLCPTA